MSSRISATICSMLVLSPVLPATAPPFLTSAILALAATCVILAFCLAASALPFALALAAPAFAFSLAAVIFALAESAVLAPGTATGTPPGPGTTGAGLSSSEELSDELLLDELDELEEELSEDEELSSSATVVFPAAPLGRTRPDLLAAGALSSELLLSSDELLELLELLLLELLEELDEDASAFFAATAAAAATGFLGTGATTPVLAATAAATLSSLSSLLELLLELEELEEELDDSLSLSDEDSFVS